MANVSGPLFSLGATKTFGKTIVFQQRKGGTTAYGKVIPYDPKTATQRNIRQYVSLGVTYWQALPGNYKNLWNNFIK